MKRVTLSLMEPRLIDSPEAMRALGQELAVKLTPGTIIALQGVMGAGKTCLVQGLAQGLGYRDEVTSPTYMLVHEYRDGARLPLYHIDCYRLEDPHAVQTAPLQDYLPSAEGVTVIEWPERIESLLKNIPTGRYIFWWRIEPINETSRSVTQINYTQR